MKKTNPHIEFIRNTILILVVLFALTPCSVKEAGSVALNIEYQRPFNKTRVAISQENSCENLVFTQVEMVKNQELQALDIVVNTSNNPVLFLFDSKEGSIIKQSKKSSDLGRPLYILYSRLKLDIA